MNLKEKIITIDNKIHQRFSISLIGIYSKFSGCLFTIKKLFVYSKYDSSSYWKKRANDPDQAAVLWKNQEYNNLYRELEYKILDNFLPMTMSEPLSILDIGCGIGVISAFLVEKNSLIRVDAVDFQEMIAVAKQKNNHHQISYIPCEAENYFDENKKYDIIISSGCFSAIRDIKKMKQAMNNCSRMIKKDGLIVMIDPFHKWSYLARVKFSSNEVQKYLEGFGLQLIYKSGVLFWPYRELLANSNYSKKKLERKFSQGEWLLSVLGQHFWADYKILVFRK